MRCNNCQAEVTISAKFCSSCAAPLIVEADSKSPAGVSREWLKEILEPEGYKVKLDPEEQTKLYTAHDTHPNLSLILNPEISLVAVVSIFRIKKLNLLQKNGFLSTVNKANGVSWLCCCYTTDDCASFNISSFIPLTERLSRRDVLRFVELFNQSKDAIVQLSGVSKYAE